MPAGQGEASLDPDSPRENEDLSQVMGGGQPVRIHGGEKGVLGGPVKPGAGDDLAGGVGGRSRELDADARDCAPGLRAHEHVGGLPALAGLGFSAAADEQEGAHDRTAHVDRRGGHRSRIQIEMGLDLKRI